MWLDIYSLRTLASVIIVIGNHTPTYNSSERRWLWSSRPSSWFIVSFFSDRLFASTLAIGAIAIMSLPASVMADSLCAAMAFAVLMDLVKVAVFFRLRIT